MMTVNLRANLPGSYSFTSVLLNVENLHPCNMTENQMYRESTKTHWSFVLYSSEVYTGVRQSFSIFSGLKDASNTQFYAYRDQCYNSEGYTITYLGQNIRNTDFNNFMGVTSDGIGFYVKQTHVEGLNWLGLSGLGHQFTLQANNDYHIYTG